MKYRIYPPCKRFIKTRGGEYFYSFPKMIFWVKNKNLYWGYMDEEDYIYLPECGNTYFEFDICLNYHSSNLNELIERFWQSIFSSLQKPDTTNIETKAKLNLDTLELYDYETTNLDIAHEYVMKISRKPCPKLEWMIKKYADFSYEYARDIIKGRWLEGEEIIKINSHYAYCYARDIINGRWLEVEEIIKLDACHAYL